MAEEPQPPEASGTTPGSPDAPVHQDPWAPPAGQARVSLDKPTDRTQDAPLHDRPTMTAYPTPTAAMPTAPRAGHPPTSPGIPSAAPANPFAPPGGPTGSPTPAGPANPFAQPGGPTFAGSATPGAPAPPAAPANPFAPPGGPTFAGPANPFAPPGSPAPAAQGSPAVPNPFAPPGPPAPANPFAPPVGADEPVPPPPIAPEGPGPAGYGYPGYPGYGDPHGYYAVPGGVSGYGWPGMPMAPSNGMGVAGLVLGIIAAVGFCLWPIAIVLGILAIIFGAVGRGKVRRGEATNPGQALAGIICGTVGIALGIAMLVIFTVVSDHPRSDPDSGDDGYATILTATAHT